MSTIPRRRPTLITLATCYADQSDDALAIPEDLTTLSDEDLEALAAQADEAFDGLYGDGSVTLSDDEYASLADLTTGIEALNVERERRVVAASERRDAAAALAARIRPTIVDDNDDEGVLQDAADEINGEAMEAADPDSPTPPAPEDDIPVAIGAPALVASQTRRGPLNIDLRSTRRAPQARKQATPAGERTMREVAYATTDGLGYASNEGITFADAGRMLDKRLASFSPGQYAAAASRGQHIRETHSLMAFKREVPAAMVASSTPESVADAVKAAKDMSRLPGGSLTAAGWCAPSEILYDLCFNASRDGLFSAPEIQVNRGGVQIPVSPSFADLYSQIGFHFTEEQAIAGEYAPGADGAPNIVGDKPCYEIECPIWEDHRLEGDGVCIVADLLTVRGFPESLALVTEGALIAHDHKVSASHISQVVAGSTPIQMTAGTLGAAAPLLAAVELQVEHYLYSGRLSRNTTLEAVFPYWVRGAIRQDLSVRLGLAEFDVSDARIDGWFRDRGVAPQYVYDWQAVDINPLDSFTTWPTTVDFLLYQAGTWVVGVDDIITLDSVYDSVLLGQNKYIALFTEEASLVAKTCVDSRVITVPLCADGTTHAGVLLECDLSPSA